MLLQNKVVLASCVLSFCTFTAQAQDTTLGTAVAAAGNSSSLQVGTGDAVQKTCGALVGVYGRQTPPEDNPAQAALFNRCGEMVQTANGLVGNEQSTANSLGWNNEQLAEGMQQLTGEEQVSTGRLATENSNGQFGNIGMRLDAIRAGARATAGGLNLVMNGAPAVGGNAGEDDSGWSWFLNGAIGTGNRDATSREDKFDYDSYGATLGFDYLLESDVVVGFAVGYTDYEVDFDDVSSFSPGTQLTNTQAGGSFDTDGYSLSGYAIGNIGRFYIDGLVSYGSNDYTNERIVQYTGSDDGTGRGKSLIVDRSMKGDTDGETVTVGTSTGTTFDLGFMDLSVDLGLSYLDVSVDSYTEQDRKRGADTAEFSGLNLAYEDQDFDSLQSILGVQFTKVFSTSFGVLVPFFDADWRHEFENDSTTVKARYASQDDGPTFQLNVDSDDPDEDYFELGVGVSAVFANNIQAFVNYSTTVDLENVDAELFTVGIRGTF